MKLLKLIPIFLLLLSPIAVAQTLTIGVQPSELSIDFYKYKSYNAQVAFFNEHGDTDAYYALTPDQCLSSILKEYPKEVLVPKGTKRVENPVIVTLRLERDNTGNKTCYLRVSAKPVGVNGTGVSIRPSVSVRFIIHQGTSESEYVSISSNSNSPSSGFLSVFNPIMNFLKPPVNKTTTITTTMMETEKIEEKIEESKNKVGNSFNYSYLIILGVVVISGILIYIFRDYLVNIATSISIFLLFTSLVYASDVNVSVDVVPAPPAPPPRLYQLSPIAGMLAYVLLPIVFALVAQKYLLGEVELTVQGLIKYLLIFVMVIIIAVGFAYVFSVL
jgi:hypothetical protein